MDLSHPFNVKKDHQASSFYARPSPSGNLTPLLQAISGMKSFALNLQVVTCGGCFAQQSVGSAISFDSSMTRTVHSQKALKEVSHATQGFPFHFSFFVGSSQNL